MEFSDPSVRNHDKYIVFTFQGDLTKSFVPPSPIVSGSPAERSRTAVLDMTRAAQINSVGISSLAILLKQLDATGLRARGLVSNSVVWCKLLFVRLDAIMRIERVNSDEASRVWDEFAAIESIRSNSGG